METWKEKRVLVIGAARQGLALTRYLINQGAQVILNDQQTADTLADAVHSMADLPVHWALGGHPLDLLDKIDMVCASGGIPLSIPLMIEAKRRGLPLSNDSRVFMDAVRCPVVGITGSAGKTTTTTLVGRIASATLKSNTTHKSIRKVWVGGNIGLPLISLVDEITTDDLVVLELSSFQLELMSSSPWVAAVLNITPNHLDRHGTMEVYIAAKTRILEFQKPQDWAILNRDDPTAWSLRNRCKGHLVSFGYEPPVDGHDGTYFKDEMLYLQQNGKPRALLPRSSILLRGEHNLQNVLAAFAISYAIGLSVEAMRAGIEGFGGVPHRLQLVRSWGGAEWYNDSIATAPERTMAGIRSFKEPLVLLLGGRDKQLPWGELAALIRQRVDHLVLFGECAGKIQKAVNDTPAGDRPYTLERCSSLRDAVNLAARIVQPGDVVLLSPGGTSFDEFRDFEDRGECFEKWVKELS
jgi:UDP-N-acetylmuramoylalanine--D-glutamate ligase